MYRHFLRKQLNTYKIKQQQNETNNFFFFCIAVDIADPTGDCWPTNCVAVAGLIYPEPFLAKSYYSLDSKPRWCQARAEVTIQWIVTSPLDNLDFNIILTTTVGYYISLKPNVSVNINFFPVNRQHSKTT